MDALDRFMRTIVAGPNCCHVWTGTKNARTGRAYFKVGQVAHIAARWLWERHYGGIPTGMVVMHSCDNPACVNVAHLSLGTQVQNIADRDAKGRNRLSATHCVNGHEFTASNTRLYGPDGKWRMCRACCRERTAAYRTRLEAENY